MFILNVPCVLEFIQSLPRFLHKAGQNFLRFIGPWAVPLSPFQLVAIDAQLRAVTSVSEFSIITLGEDGKLAHVFTPWNVVVG
ncbi:hypothetical protein AN476_21875 [Phaeobacter sp. 11ANDIMAR09]|nr:hypothetical protein AN476_21875 [Phaeobacter sp. 11ANDIMAR09]